MSLVSIGNFDLVPDVESTSMEMEVYVQPRRAATTGRHYVHISAPIAKSIYDMRSHPHYNPDRLIARTYLPKIADIFWGQDDAGRERWGILKSLGAGVKRHYLK